MDEVTVQKSSSNGYFRSVLKSDFYLYICSNHEWIVDYFQPQQVIFIYQRWPKHVLCVYQRYVFTTYYCNCCSLDAKDEPSH